jgi:integrase
LESSGVRVGELLKLRFNDVDMTADPPTVYTRGEYTKSGDKYVTFLTSEAREALTE